MVVEIEIALNFLLTFLYCNLPRRRVDQFGMELCKALKAKFKDHWYPDKPYKGSAYRSLRLDADDTVLSQVANECGLNINEILHFLPRDMTMWIDPGEVSYMIGDRGPLRILLTDFGDMYEEYFADSEIMRAFGAEDVCFHPNYFGGRRLISMNRPYPPYGSVPLSNFYPNSMNSFYGSLATQNFNTAPVSFQTSTAPLPTFLPRTTAPLTFTTASFAQTKFGSTKLKTNGRRHKKMSSTEFSNYIHQRAMQQQMQQRRAHHNYFRGRVQYSGGQNYRTPADNYNYQHGATHFQPQYTQAYDNSQYMPIMYNGYQGPENYYPQYVSPQQNQPTYNAYPNYSHNYATNYPTYQNYPNTQDEYNQIVDGINNLGLGTDSNPE